MNCKKGLITLLFCSLVFLSKAQEKITLLEVGEGWAKNSVNAVIFRKNSLVSFKNYQFIAYYDADAFVVLGKRKEGKSTWELQKTNFKGNASDAHNSISIMVDGDGFLHLSWDHHNNALRYAVSKAPFSLIMGEKQSMTGSTEGNVTYPEFYRLPNGNLLFFYRNGASGKGNLVMNQYDLKTKKWSMVQENLIDGEGKRNAYWQACLDSQGTIHLSWVWRESADVASNHDMAYARSKDGGKTWENSQGIAYQLPITAQNAEYACKIPQKSELINQTSMVADAEGNPYIATYWRPANESVPQYHVIYLANQQWQVSNLGFRKTPFSLSGVGTKRIPISRPQILAWSSKKNTLSAMLIFRDAERGDKVSTAITTDLSKGNWQIKDISETSVGSWEPTYDTELWQNKGDLHLFVEKVDQADGEGKVNIPAQKVQVLTWKEVKKIKMKEQSK